MGLRISIFVKKIHFCMGLPHTKVGFKKLIHVAPIDGTLTPVSIGWPHKKTHARLANFTDLADIEKVVYHSHLNIQWSFRAIVNGGHGIPPPARTCATQQIRHKCNACMRANAKLVTVSLLTKTFKKKQPRKTKAHQNEYASGGHDVQMGTIQSVV